MKLLKILPFVALSLFANIYCFGQSSAVKVDFSNVSSEELDIARMGLGLGGFQATNQISDKIQILKQLNPKLIRIFLQPYYKVLTDDGYDFSILDSAVNDILQTGATPLMNISLKPKSLFPDNPKNDPYISRPKNFSDWEGFIFKLVSHYKNTKVKYWEVTNESDIGGGGTPYGFDAKGYVEFYNHTVKAIRKADNGAKVGGPALAYYKSDILPALLQSCSINNIPLDFVSWHFYSNDPKTASVSTKYVKDLLKNYPKLNPLTIINEWSFSLASAPTDLRFQPCFIAETIWQMIDAGLDISCYYHINDCYYDYNVFSNFLSSFHNNAQLRFWNRRTGFLGLFDLEGQVRPSFYVFKMLSWLSGKRILIESENEGIHGFATYDSSINTYSVMIWNFNPTSKKIDLKIKNLNEKVMVRPFKLVADFGGTFDNKVLQNEDYSYIESGNNTFSVTMNPYEVRSWIFEGSLKNN